MANANKTATVVERLLTGHIRSGIRSDAGECDLGLLRYELLTLWVIDVLIDMLVAVVCRGRIQKFTAGGVWKKRRTMVDIPTYVTDTA